jgi:uncharacterized RDD family membrane protein YckC
VSTEVETSSAAWQYDEEALSFRHTRRVLHVGQDYALRAGDVVRELRSVLGDVSLAGHVERDTVVVLGGVRLAGSAVVDGSLVVIGGNATIDPGAVVSRDLVVVGGSLSAPRDFSPGGDTVAVGTPMLGDRLRAFVPWLTRGLLWGRLIVPGVGWIWLVVALALLVYLVVNALFHGPVGASADAVQARPLSMLLLGLLILVLTIPAIVILAATVVGLIVVPFVLCALFVAGLVGKAGVARALGRGLFGAGGQESRLQALRSFVVGAGLLLVAYSVPVLGIVAWALSTVLAVGASAVMVRGRLRREHPLPEPDTAEIESGAPTSFDDRGAEDRAASREPTLAPAPIVNPVVDARLSGFPRAAFLDRVAAFALDCVLVGIMVLALNFSRHDGMFPLLLISYHVAFWAWRGTTLGGVVVGLRVVRLDEANLRFVDALVRGLAGLLSLAALGIGCFWMLQDPERQMWHDKSAGTAVIKMPRALVLS